MTIYVMPETEEWFACMEVSSNRGLLLGVEHISLTNSPPGLTDDQPHIDIIDLLNDVFE